VQPDSEKDPAVVLSYLLGHKLPAEELYEAFGLKKSTYYDLKDKGTLTTADRLITAANNLNINPLALLIRYNHISMEHLEQLLSATAQEASELGKPTAGSSRRRALLRLLSLELSRQPNIPPL
jgi:hypothetical protein